MRRLSRAIHRALERSPGAVDPAIALGLGVACTALLLATAHTLGYARDEGFYFHAAESYARWFEQLAREPAVALERRSIDAAFAVNREHPVLMKSLFALSWLAQKKWHLFAEEGTSFRFPAMLTAGMTTGLCYLWGTAVRGRAAGLVAAALFALVPTTFYHAHLACFDVPIAGLWLLVAWCYHRSLVTRSVGWALATAVSFGLALDTKHNSWFLPIAFVAHLLVRRGPGLVRDLRAGRLAVPLAWPLMAVIGPVVLVTLWPFIWYDTAERLAWYVRFHTRHDYYNIEFLGETYWQPPFPRSYAWLTTAATVPVVALVLFVIGLAVAARERLPAYLARWRGHAHDQASEASDPGGARLLWLLGVAVNYGPWLSRGTPIFGGTKHWLAAYPFVALFGGLGFAWAAAKLVDAAPTPAWRRAAPWLLGASVVVAPAVETLRAHPWGLSAYTPLVGGASGAASLGFNRGFWGYTTGSLVDELNARVPPGGSVYIHDTAWDAWRMLQRDGRLRADLRVAASPAGADAAIYHHEQHMSGVEQQIWIALGTTTPAAVRGLDGVPIVWLYLRRGL